MSAAMRAAMSTARRRWSAARAVCALAGLGLAGVVLAGCQYFQPQAVPPYHPPGGLAFSPPNALPGNPGNGPAIYQRDCGWCHGNRGQGTVNGPSLLGGTNGPALTDFMLSTGRMPITTPDQKDAIHQKANYSPADMAAIVAYVRSFGATGPPIPAVNLARASLPQGEVLYQANCAACHSVTGEGGALATGKPANVNGYVLPRQGLVAPSVLKASPVQVAEAIRTGPPGMPVFGPNQFSDAQVNSIVGYVHYLSTGGDRGGLSLGRIGPVAEGAIGWLVALALLLLLVRWIGTSGHQPKRAHGGDDAHGRPEPPGDSGARGAHP